MKLKILVGTVTSTAEYVAQAIELGCADLVASIDVVPMDGLGSDAFADAVLYLVCTSTHGAGDVPDNARSLYDALDADPRYLGHVRYGVIALGDSASHAPTFAFAGRMFDERLQGLGAQRIGEICVLDAADDTPPEDAAVAWCRGWLGPALAAVAGGKNP